MKAIVTTLTVFAFTAALSLADGAPGSKAGAARAGRQGHRSIGEIFKKLDTDGNGSISLAEFKARPRHDARPGAAKPSADGAKRAHRNPEEIFKKLDKNGDGALSLEEIKAIGRHRNHGPRGKAPSAKPAA